MPTVARIPRAGSDVAHDRPAREEHPRQAATMNGGFANLGSFNALCRKRRKRVPAEAAAGWANLRGAVACIRGRGRSQRVSGITLVRLSERRTSTLEHAQRLPTRPGGPGRMYGHGPSRQPER
jgi:hypothetical protein